MSKKVAGVENSRERERERDIVISFTVSLFSVLFDRFLGAPLEREEASVLMIK